MITDVQRLCVNSVHDFLHSWIPPSNLVTSACECSSRLSQVWEIRRITRGEAGGREWKSIKKEIEEGEEDGGGGVGGLWKEIIDG